MTLLRSFDRVLVRVESVFLVVFLGAMVLLAFAQVVLRNLFDTGFLWGDILVRHLVLWAGFAGAAIAASEERHIGIDVLAKFLATRTRHFVQSVTGAFACVVCVYLAHAALRFLLDEYTAGGEFIFSLPTWVALVIIPSGYVLVAVHAAIKAIEHLVAGIQGPVAKE